MVYIGTGLMKDFRSGTSKNGNEYNLLELAGEDYAKHTIFVPAEKVALVTGELSYQFSPLESLLCSLLFVPTSCMAIWGYVKLWLKSLVVLWEK